MNDKQWQEYHGNDCCAHVRNQAERHEIDTANLHSNANDALLKISECLYWIELKISQADREGKTRLLTWQESQSIKKTISLMKGQLNSLKGIVNDMEAKDE